MWLLSTGNSAGGGGGVGQGWGVAYDDLTYIPGTSFVMSEMAETLGLSLLEV